MILLSCGRCRVLFFLDFGWSQISLSASQLTDATANRGLAPMPPVVWMVSPNAFRTDLTALASGGIPDRVSTSRCVMMHLGRGDRGKENAVSPPFLTVSQLELEIGTSLQVWSA